MWKKSVEQLIRNAQINMIVGNIHLRSLNHAQIIKTIQFNRCYSNNERHQIISSSQSIGPKIQAWLSNVNKSMPATGQMIDNSKIQLKTNFNGFLNWFDNITHTNEIREAHKTVDSIQEKLQKAQHLRREVLRELNNIRNELNACYAHQAECQKDHPRYLALVRKEIELSAKEKQTTEEFNLLDQSERDLFMHLQSAVKTSHEKEKIQTNSAKYWSIVASVVGTILGIVGTTIFNYFRNTELNTKFHQINNGLTKILNSNQTIITEQRGFFEALKLRDRRQLEKEARLHIQSNSNQNHSNESWMHWIARKTYLLSAVNYFINRN